MTGKLKKIITFILVFTCFLWFTPSLLNSVKNMKFSSGENTVYASSDTRVTTANLNLRKGPGTSYSVLTVMKNGSTVEVLNVSGVWAKVVYNGITGYASTAYMKEFQSSKMVTTANLNMRIGPSINDKIIRTLPRGTEVSVISTSNGWAKVNYSGSVGYCSLNYLRPVSTQPPATNITMKTTAHLNMRTGPSTNNPVIRVIPQGAEVLVTNRSGGWAKVAYNGSEGYCSLTYLTDEIIPPVQSTAYYTTEELNLRNGPGVGYKIIAVMPYGSKVIAVPSTESWFKVTYEGKTGYAHKAYLTKNLVQGPSKVITKGIKNPSKKEIALTFDAGWEYKTTIPLLNMLDRYSVKATFFLRANWVKDHPDLARAIRDRGHSIQNHSLTHPHMKEMSRAAIESEFKESTAIFKNVLGLTPTLFRPPFGEYNDLVLDVAKESGYPYTIMWSIDTIDWAETIRGETVTTTFIYNRVLDNVSNQDIVLMHIAYQKTVDALPKMIETLKSRGYAFRTVLFMLTSNERYRI
ncbi:MAG: SH3 domain-containing protein [Clostridium sp.]|nr:SH3 domain-containing protein [Clostridium sp.]